MKAYKKMELNLAKIFERLQQEGNTEDEVNTWRNLLCQTVGEILGHDLDQEINTSAQKGYTVCLQFVAHMINVKPQVFVKGIPSNSQDTPSLTNPRTTQEDLEAQQCYAVSCWVIRHVLSLLASPQATQLHGQARGVLVSLLQMTRTKDLCAFRSVVLEMVAALADLADFDDFFYGDTEEGSDYRPVLKRFETKLPALQQSQSDGGNQLTSKAVLLSNPDMNQQLQININLMLVKLVLDVCQFAGDLVKGALIHSNSDAVSRDLWTTLGRQLETGDVPLKIVSLDLCQQLLQHGGLPPPPELDYILDCLSALAALLCSPDKDIIQEDQQAVETSYLGLLQQLVESSKGTAGVLTTLAEALITHLTIHGTKGLHSLQTKHQLCGLLARMLGKLPARGMWRDRARKLGVVLLQEINTEQKAEYMVSLLRQIAVMDTEVKTTAIAPEPTSMDSASDCDAANKNRSGRAGKRASNLSTCQFDAKCFVHVLVDTMIKMCDPTSAKDLLECIEANCVAVETLCYFVAKWHDAHNESKGKFSSQGVVRPSPGYLLSSAKLTAVYSSWKAFLEEICQNKDKLTQGQVASGYVTIVRAIGALLAVQDVITIDSGLLHGFIWILSLPWLANEMSWEDLKPGESTQELLALSTRMTDDLDTADGAGIKAECCHVLCLFPKEAAFKWRTQVLKMALSDTSAQTRIGAIQGFPFFLHYSGANANHLIHTPLQTCVHMGEEKDLDVQKAMAEIIGPLTCVVARMVGLQRALPEDEDSSVQVFRCMQVQCQECDEAPPVDQEIGASASTGCAKIVDPGMFVPFMELLKCQDHAIKLAMIGCYKRLFGHLGTQSGNTATYKILKCTLGLMQTENYEVRMAFSEVIRHMLGVRKQSGSQSQSKIDNLLVSHLKEAAHAAKQSRDVSLMETILLSVGHIAKVAEGNLLLVTIIILLDSICAPSCPLAAAVARTQVRQMAEQKKVNMRHLFLQFGRSITKVLVEHLEECQKRPSSSTDPISIIHNVAHVFEFDETKNFLKRTEHLLLPHLAKKATPTASNLIKLIAKQVGDPNHKGPLARNIRHIYCHLVCSCQPQELAKALTFLESELDWDLGTLLRQGQNVDSELLLHLGAHYDQVLNGLKIWTTKLGLCSKSIDSITDQLMADILQPKLLGILVHFDNYLNNGTVPLEDKKTAYESVIRLIRLMGPQHITQVRMRLMTTLKIGLKFKQQDFPDLCCKAWNCFVHTVETAALGPMLSQIIVSLLPLLKLLPKQVADIFSFLVVENRKCLHQHFHELYFMPDIPELKDINTVLKKYMKGQYGAADVRTQLEHLLKGVSHESQDVRQLALSKLRHLLHQNQTAIHQMVLGSESVDPTISNIVTTLMQGCREADPNLRSLYGECLGELGAIDPGRLDVMQRHEKLELHKFQATVGEINFAFGLITELGRAFLRAEDRNTQDCVAFAMQELIQLYQITDESDSSSPGAQLWRRFPEDVQEILVPLKNSRYVLNVKYNWSKLTKPIYRSHKGSKYASWVCTLAGYLSSKVTEERAKRVFESCWGVIRNDSQIALYLLPYVIVHCLLDGSHADKAEVSQEILAVLQHAQEPDAHHNNQHSNPTEGGGHSTLSSDLSHMSAQTVFSVLDHLQKWTQHRVMVLSVMSQTSRGSSRPAPMDARLREDPAYQCINGFLTKIPQDILAYASYNCGAYTRSLRHWEHYIKAAPGEVSSQHLDFLQRLYVALEEVDGVTGVTTVKVTPPSLGEQILAHESSGQLSDASVCYDQAIQLEPRDLGLRQGLLKCRLSLGELHSALDLCSGMIAAHPSWSSQLNAFRVEAAWKLGQWDNLQAYLKTEDHSRNWNVGVGKLLLAVKSKDEQEFRKQLKIVRSEQMGPLSAASMEAGSYHRGYQYIARLHMLRDLEHDVQTLLHFAPPQDSSESQAYEEELDPAALQRQWEDRLHVTQASYRIQEPILNLRRLILGLAHTEQHLQMDQVVGRCWLQSARVARECGQIQTAHSSLLSAHHYKMPELRMEKAKWLWDRGDYDQAQSCLERAIEEFYPDRSKFKAAGNESEEDKAKRIACAKVLLQLGRYCEETASWESNRIVLHYKEVKDLHGQWEDAYFFIAKYYDKLMGALGVQDQRGEFIIQVVMNFGSSLQYGNQYIYQSMPRMLTLWLDYGAEVTEKIADIKHDHTKNVMRAAISHLNKLMSQFLKKLAPYQFLTAFPQLISRICHAHPDVFAQLKEIIAQLLQAFPQQAMWMMMAVSKSSYSMRMMRCQDIFAVAKSMNKDLNKFLQDATKLTDRLLDLCNRPVEGSANTLSISQHFKPLQRLVNDRSFSQILIPLQSLMNPILPMEAMTTGAHDPFPGTQVYLRGLEDVVEILPSLQKPKKLVFQGSDGKLHIVLCKPKDDLRKDARLMEFNGIINKCLRKDAESRRRGLHIRTYNVIPLNEECGMLEWVSNTSGLRHILLKIYKERGIYTTGAQLKHMQHPAGAPLEKKLTTFRNMLLPRHPAVFSEWFLTSFPDPTSWYNARLAYCRTIAVMSIAGYIVGLGDRHGENILFDSTTGDCVHVDFNCLFNKGETFDYPEIVPFRLTHNMVEAMGPLGCEGIFRRSCEVTMRVMRDQMDPLMTVLKTLIYDPLVEWSKPARGRSSVTDTGEIKNEKAQTHVKNIEARLKGILKNKTKPRGLPLSVEGHTNHLIKEATNEKNLARMYIGWAAYM